MTQQDSSTSAPQGRETPDPEAAFIKHYDRCHLCGDGYLCDWVRARYRVVSPPLADPALPQEPRDLRKALERGAKGMGIDSVQCERLLAQLTAPTAPQEPRDEEASKWSDGWYAFLMQAQIDRLYQVEAEAGNARRELEGIRKAMIEREAQLTAVSSVLRVSEMTTAETKDTNSCSPVSHTDGSTNEPPEFGGQ
jgi:hypothetical protein